MHDRPPQPEARKRELLTAMSSRLAPPTGALGCNAVLSMAIGAPGARLLELTSLPLGPTGQRLVALRYLVANGAIWLAHYAWEPPLTRTISDGPVQLRALMERIETTRAGLQTDSLRALTESPWETLAALLEVGGGPSDGSLELLVGLHAYPELARELRERLRASAVSLHAAAPRTCDLVYLATYDLRTLPATTVGEGALHHLIVADKGEMGVRAVRVAVAAGITPVVLFSKRDDSGALQVRLAKEAGGFAIALAGTFRESYANPQQIVERLRAAYATRFGELAEAELARSALYPGYGPLAESGAAIRCFRQAGVVFVGPSQDVVEHAGDKRKFRTLAESIDPAAVTPGVVLESSDPEAIAARIDEGHAAGRFTFPGRLKAANGGGGRGQVVIHEPSGVPAATLRVLAEIRANGWGPGVMFEQNIPETVHLEVQVLRDRFGNTRHFGMRDCTEQRANQKIQEEAPPALLRAQPELQARMCDIAVRLANAVGYVGACTVELMYRAGHFYLLEMNTRIQVEHPVTEEAFRIRNGDSLERLDLVRLQIEIARGAALPFAQADVVQVRVARELRVNAESWRGDLKDSRDGERGLFLPNAGIFDRIEIPRGEEVRDALREEGVGGIAELGVRFDVGFAVGDKLVNKDPTFGKLIVSVAPADEHEDAPYELLRLACLAVLARTKIEGRQLNASGRIIRGSSFATNLEDHRRILESELMRQHARGGADGRHVGWVVQMLRLG